MNQARSRYALFVLALLVAATSAFAEQGRVDVVGGFATDDRRAIGRDINDAGTVVGDFDNDWIYIGPIRPFQASSGGSISDLGQMNGGGIPVPEARAHAVSETGGVSVGYSVWGVRRAFRRTGAGMVSLEPVGADSFASEADDVSGNGSVIVGYSEKWGGVAHAFRWTQAGGLVDLGSLAGAGGKSRARGVSGDGTIIVGESETTVGGETHAFYLSMANGVLHDLGTIGDAAGNSCAFDVSSDGQFVVGDSATPDGDRRAFLYSSATGTMTALPNLGDVAGDSIAYSVSTDGRTVAGASPSAAHPEGEACVWLDGVPYALREMMAVRYGFDMANWKTLSHARCSPNGLRFTGQGSYVRSSIPGTQPQDVAFNVTIRPDLDPPTIDSVIEEGSTQVVRVGETFRATFAGSDPDGGRISLTTWGYFGNATLTPPIGTSSMTSPYETVYEVTPTAGSFGHTYDVLVGFSDTMGGSGQGNTTRRRFKIQVPPNQAPTADPIEPVVVECVNGVHRVTLSTVVRDVEKQSLLTKWLVDGETLKEETVAAGTTVTFEHEFEHGVHDVEFRVFDNYAPSTKMHTTVTVEDTQAPILIVAPDVVVGTDAGEDFASNVVLTLPTATDASGHDVTLESDEPSTYPVGETIVTWTATDEEGNVATAGQKVIVEDREAPTIAGSTSVELFVDPGKIFSTAELPLPAVSDNVDDPSAIQIVSDAPLSFPIGTTQVTFTAIDGGGNSATWPMDVTVVNRKPQANAGANVVVTTTSEKGLRVSLDGSASSDPDAHRLKFLWSAPDLKLAGAKSATPSGLFPVGRTFATLTVTDPAGLTSVDRVRVVVKLKNGKPRASGAAANASFSRAVAQAKQAATGGRSGASSLSGLSYASAAAAYGDVAGEFVRWEEGQSEADALLSYSELRLLQQAYGAAATNALLAAYVETGDESLLTAALSAASGSAYATVDLSE